MFNPPHPGRILGEYLTDRTLPELATQTGISEAALLSLIEGRSSVTEQQGEALSATLGDSDGLWLRLQQAYDEWQAHPYAPDDAEV